MFLYAGEVSNWDLVMQDIVRRGEGDADSLKHERIMETVHDAYERRLASWASDPLLMPLGTNIGELRSKGLAMFGEKNMEKLLARITEAADGYTDKVLMLGWGDGPRNFVLHEENRDGSVSHAPSGFAAIGSGAAVALSQLHLLGQAKHTTLEETLYRIAAAKFAAEHAEGVGESTTIYVTWKKTDADGDYSPGRFIRTKEKQSLREIWEEWGKPTMPGEFPLAQRRSSFGKLRAIVHSSLIPSYVFDESSSTVRNFRMMRDDLISMQSASQKSKDSQ